MRTPSTGLDALSELLEDCRMVAVRLGCARELEHVAALAQDYGAARQRLHVRRAGIAALPSWLAGKFAPAALLAAA